MLRIKFISDKYFYSLYQGALQTPIVDYLADLLESCSCLCVRARRSGKL